MGIFKKKRSEELLRKIGSDLGDAMIAEMKTKRGFNKMDLYMCSLGKLVEQEKIHGKFSKKETNVIVNEADKKIKFLDFLFGEK